MATNIASLSVQLGLDAAEYTRGLSKAEVQAQQFAANTRSAILEVGKILGGLEIGRQVLENAKAIITQAAALSNLSDATGSSVESLSRLSNQAKIAGTDFSTLQSLVLKLSAGMAGADDESTKAKEALKLLGITTRDPAQALQEVAIKLGTYAEGVNKAGLAVALFGKQGPAFLSTLKDIAELQDVGATTSTKQAAEANALQKEFARLSVESTSFANVSLSSVVPALTDTIREMRTGIDVAGGFFNAFRLFSTIDLGDIPGQIRKINDEVVRLQKDKAEDAGFSKFFNDLVGKSFDPAIADAQKKLQFLEKIQRDRARLQIASDVQAVMGDARPTAPFIASGKDSKALKEKTDEAQRLLESLEKQLQGTLELTTEETALVAIYDIEAKSLKAVNEETKARILDNARQIDTAKELKKAADDARKAEEEAGRIRARNSQQLTRDIEHAQREAQTIRDANDGIKEQIAFLKGGEEGLRAYTDAKLAKAIAESADKEAMLANAGAAQGLIDAVHEQTVALQERQRLTGDLRLAEQFAKEQKAAQDFANALTDSFANAFSGFVDGTKSARDAFKDFTTDVTRMITQLAAHKIGDAIFGGTTASGPDFFSLIGKFFGLFAGAGGATGGIGAGGSGGLAFAANGTDFARGGMTLVGERGPEIVDLPSGARVTPNGKLPSGVGGQVINIHQNINVMPGANRASAMQAATEAGKQARLAVWRNG